MNFTFLLVVMSLSYPRYVPRWIDPAPSKVPGFDGEPASKKGRLCLSQAFCFLPSKVKYGEMGWKWHLFGREREDKMFSISRHWGQVAIVLSHLNLLQTVRTEGICQQFVFVSVLILTSVSGRNCFVTNQSFSHSIMHSFIHSFIHSINQSSIQSIN